MATALENKPQQQNTGLAKADPRLVNLQMILKQARPHLAAVLPKYITPERMEKLLMTECRLKDDLLECDIRTVVGAFIAASELHLEPGSALGYAYLVPYGRTCQFLLGYRGMIELVRRSRELKTIEARVVHVGDEFSHEYGTNPRIIHRPCSKPGDMTHVYVVAHLMNGGTQFDVMDKNAVELIRSRSRAKKGPWQTDYEEMAKKTVIRRLAKLLPMSVEDRDVINSEDEVELGVRPPVVYGENLDFLPPISAQPEKVIDAEVNQNPPQNLDDLSEQIEQEVQTSDQLKGAKNPKTLLGDDDPRSAGPYGQ